MRRRTRAGRHNRLQRGKAPLVLFPLHFIVYKVVDNPNRPTLTRNHDSAFIEAIPPTTLVVQIYLPTRAARRNLCMSQAAVAGGRDAGLVQDHGKRAVTEGARTPSSTYRQQRRSRRPRATWESLASEDGPASGRQGVEHAEGRPVRRRSPRRGRTPADAPSDLPSILV